MNSVKGILEKQELRMTNVLSFRKKLTQNELTAEMQRIGKFIEDGGYNKTAPTVTATFSVEQQGQEQLMDFELLIPLDKPFIPPDGCVCKPEILLTNAVVFRHIGSPAKIQDSYNELSAYLQQHNLLPVTVGYNVTVQEAKSPAEVDSMIVDIYIGVSPNVL